LADAAPPHGEGVAAAGPAGFGRGLALRRVAAASAQAAACAQCCAALEAAGAAQASREEANAALLAAARAGDVAACRRAVEEGGAAVDALRPAVDLSAAARLAATGDGFRPLHAAVAGGHAG
jgi:hypothetical protein